jgi:hypothetical protein
VAGPTHLILSINPHPCSEEHRDNSSMISNTRIALWGPSILKKGQMMGQPDRERERGGGPDREREGETERQRDRERQYRLILNMNICPS